MKKMPRLPRILLTALLALSVCIAIIPAVAEDDLIWFEDMGVYVKIPDSVMYVTRESPETEDLFSVILSAGISYKDFQQYMQANQMYIYGVMMTDYNSEFSLVIDTLETPVNLTESSEIIMQIYLNQAKKVLEGLGAVVSEYGIYHGELYNGFWFHYTMDMSDGNSQHVIQYSLIDGIRTVNIRVYGFNGEFSEENEEIVKNIYNTVTITPPGGDA